MIAALLLALAPSQVLTVPQVPVVQPAAPPPAAIRADEDTPEEIAADAARDLRDSRFYNRPGATRGDYDNAWQACRLIARGSRTPSGGYTTVYNPSLISPMAAGIASGIGAGIGAAIAEGIQRRANRRNCLLARGWRVVEVSGAERARIAALTDAERDAYFARIVGAGDLSGTMPGAAITAWTDDFSTPRLAPEAEQ